jgi:hypothetical protein
MMCQLGKLHFEFSAACPYLFSDYRVDLAPQVFATDIDLSAIVFFLHFGKSGRWLPQTY